MVDYSKSNQFSLLVMICAAVTATEGIPSFLWVKISMERLISDIKKAELFQCAREHFDGQCCIQANIQAFIIKDKWPSSRYLKSFDFPVWSISAPKACSSLHNSLYMISMQIARRTSHAPSSTAACRV